MNITLERKKEIVLQVIELITAKTKRAICSTLYGALDGKEKMFVLSHCSLTKEADILELLFGDLIAIDLYRPKQLIEINGLDYWYHFNLVGQSKRKAFLNKLLDHINNEILERLHRGSKT